MEHASKGFVTGFMSGLGGGVTAGKKRKHAAIQVSPPPLSIRPRATVGLSASYTRDTRAPSPPSPHRCRNITLRYSRAAAPLSSSSNAYGTITTPANDPRAVLHYYPRPSASPSAHLLMLGDCPNISPIQHSSVPQPAPPPPASAPWPPAIFPRFSAGSPLFYEPWRRRPL